MDMDVFGIDDLLDFSNDHLFSSSTSSSATTTTIAATDSDDNHHHHHHHFSYLELNNPTTTTTPATNKYYPTTTTTTTNFADYLCVPSDDIAELEWLSNFVDDSFTEIPAYSVTGTTNVRSDTSSKTKRSRSTKTNNDRNTRDDSTTTAVITRKERSTSTETLPRKCTHCSSEKTPQWRTGPLGPKTLCNACGVRYKSGRLVPEYRPAASPTFVLTQHSNSHRKVMELRRQKELYRQQQQQQQQQEQEEIYGNEHRRFQVC